MSQKTSDSERLQGGAMPTQSILFRKTYPNRTVMMLTNPVTCKVCQSVHYVICNTDGQTTCLGCAPERGIND
jgi:hypothetical protein